MNASGDTKPPHAHDPVARGVIGDVSLLALVPMAIWFWGEVLLTGNAVTDPASGIRYIEDLGNGTPRIVEGWFWWTKRIAAPAAIVGFAIMVIGMVAMNLLDFFKVQWYLKQEQTFLGGAAVLILVPITVVFVIIGMFIFPDLGDAVTIAHYDLTTHQLVPLPP